MTVTVSRPSQKRNSRKYKYLRGGKAQKNLRGNVYSSHNQRTQYTLPKLAKGTLSVSLNYGMGFLGLFVLEPCLENNHKPYIDFKMAYQQENIRADPETVKAFRLQHREIQSHLQQQKNPLLTKQHCWMQTVTMKKGYTYNARFIISWSQLCSKIFLMRNAFAISTR